MPKGLKQVASSPGFLVAVSDLRSRAAVQRTSCFERHCLFATLCPPSAIIERTRDVKGLVRKDAFNLLAEKCSIRNLSIQQRIQLLSDGLNDCSELVQEACTNGLLRSWSLSLDGDLLSLLARLDVESSPQVSQSQIQEEGLHELVHVCVAAGL